MIRTATPSFRGGRGWTVHKRRPAAVAGSVGAAGLRIIHAVNTQRLVTLRHRPDCRHGARGFTILELLVALVVVGVLTAVAYPSFTASIRKGRRAEAFGKLNAVQLAQERWRSNNALYSSQLASLPTAVPPGLGIPLTTGDGRYALALGGVPSATGYEVIASAVSGTSQIDDGNCAQLGVRITNANIEYGSAATAQVIDYAAGNRCWAR